MKLQKWYVLFSLLLVAGFVVSLTTGAGRAAELNPGNIGATCNGTGTWHFVNNQVGFFGAAGTLTATFSCGTQTVTAFKVNPNGNQQFIVETTGTCTLLSAFTTLADGVTPMPGNLLLSDFVCAAATPTPTPTPTATPTPTVTPSPAP